MHEDGDGVVRRFELRGVGISGGGETGIDVAQHSGRAERESRHSWMLVFVLGIAIRMGRVFGGDDVVVGVG